ncbi:helix-turn-helix domain-containing protein [Saccharopolyspora sp. NFXS83]|uniref:IclR family transcriptional regulator n=1 Tax=Saccharopolyspora sp. NFXS83 TaxID=2993560 RepID=UPI00224B7AC7|nr:helix-turn-helix domain-containing protein [Saccharopolyspora sp. NFXS83]MCX2729423.1 helix-turn-helix domain-containing protein [Saccharopolyspora sp. NFXS83]
MRVQNQTGVGVLDRVVAILDAVERRPMGSSELARHLGLSAPTAQRLAAGMVAHNLLRRDAEGRHHLGQRFASSQLADAATPVLEWLVQETGESAQLWVRRGDQRLCLVGAESESELRVFLPAGSALPQSEGGSAAAALSADDSSESNRRWFESVSQRTPGLGSVSAPVRAHGEIVAAVCVAAPLPRVPSPGEAFGHLVAQAAEPVAGKLVTPRPSTTTVDGGSESSIRRPPTYRRQ